MNPRISKDEYAPFYQGYINTLGEIDLMVALTKGMDEFVQFMETIPENRLSYSYAPKKWTTAEVLVHIMDTERVFQYRALCFSRNDKTLLPGFDQDGYVPFSNALERTKDDLMAEYVAVRKATIALFKSFNDRMLKRIGVANDSKMSVAASGYILCGHQEHHKRILMEKYLL